MRPRRPVAIRGSTEERTEILLLGATIGMWRRGAVRSVGAIHAVRPERQPPAGDDGQNRTVTSTGIAREQVAPFPTPRTRGARIAAPDIHGRPRRWAAEFWPDPARSRGGLPSPQTSTRSVACIQGTRVVWSPITALSPCYRHEHFPGRETVSSADQRRVVPLSEQREARTAAMRRDAILLQQPFHLGFGSPPTTWLVRDREAPTMNRFARWTAAVRCS